MKVRFKNTEAKFAFVAGSRANMSIAEYMGNEFHEVKIYFDGSLELVDDEGNNIILDKYGKVVPENGNGWNACFLEEETTCLEFME